MRGRAEGGWALVSVLWGLVIVSLIAAMMLSSARVSYRQAAFSVAEAQRRADADAATVRAVLGLLDSRVDHRWRIDGVPQTWAFDGRVLRFAIEDEGGKIDLNASGDFAIRQLLKAVAPQANGLADKILDWRDQKGDLHRLQGATGADYAAEGRDYRPRGGPFQSVDELKLVLGMTPEIFDRLAPAVTVFSGRSKANLATAPREVLMAVMGDDAATADAAIAARAGTAPDRSPQAVAGGIVQAGISTEGWAFSIHVAPMGGRLTESRVVRLLGGKGGRFILQDAGL
ncbi:hypothetical protein GCM10011611_67330 [Aliidongia dinghuensis]|uniref:T2SS protein K first SAM-like domain-containing protein n=1 Tax=Aliidongia dinghuensis TaxID=1867774 RepID=A0A8J2Z0R3_9PROT|nr:type II secretion system protein GspK [Aliidongia dinghuensis]GGF51395.1 hypothetical protein GCM10011611_67330 [Aliidongia dinghuensis]